MHDDMTLTLNRYQVEANKTAVYPGSGEAAGLAYAVLGLAGEAGELANQAKKVLRDDDGTIDPKRLERMRAELGDVLWYVAAVAHELGVDLGAVAAANLAKLAKRAEDGTIRGDGEERKKLQLRAGDVAKTDRGRLVVVQRFSTVTGRREAFVALHGSVGGSGWWMETSCLEKVES